MAECSLISGISYLCPNTLRGMKMIPKWFWTFQIHFCLFGHDVQDSSPDSAMWKHYIRPLTHLSLIAICFG